jgi:hypothetical protein
MGCFTENAIWQQGLISFRLALDRSRKLEAAKKINYIHLGKFQQKIVYLGESFEL